MKIAMIINSSSGLYNFRKDLILRMIADGHEVIALTPLDKRVDQLKELGIRLIPTTIDRRGINPLKDLKLLITYRNIFKSEQPNLAITYTIKPNVYAGIVCRFLKIPYAANVTGLGSAFEGSSILRLIAIWLNKFALKKAQCVFFENSDNLKIYKQNKIISSTQGVLLNGAGVNLKYFFYQPYPDDDTEIRFLFMGRVMKEKGIDELLSAMQKLVKDGYKCKLDILGSYEESYKDTIDRYQAEGWLVYHGYQEDVRKYIAKAHCFVLPSWHEGMANTNLESAASGRPVITSNIPGCREAVLDNLSGFLCENKNPDDLYGKMKTFLELSHDEKSKMGRIGRQHMEEVFDKDKVVKTTVKYLY